MKRLSFLVLIILVVPAQSLPQNYLGYYFTTTQYGYYTEITDGTISTAAGNDGAENILLPFPFEYMGITYTNARISVNGWLEMGQNYTGWGYENELESTVKKPLLCPLWDDLYADSQSEISYKTVGNYPARFFIVQWKDIMLYSGFRKSFQIRLWELDGTIDFIYGPGLAFSGYIDSYSVGMNNQTGGTGNFISLTPDEVYFPAIDTVTANNQNSDVSLLTEGMQFNFIPNSSLSATLYQVPDTVIAGNPNQKILPIIFACHEGSILTSPWVTDFNFNTNGTTNINDIQNAKLFFTGSSPEFSTANQIGPTYPDPNGTFAIGGYSQYLNNNDLTYFWLTYDISPDADPGNIVDANCFRVDFQGCCPSIVPDSSLAGAYCTIVNDLTPETLTIGAGGDYISITEAFQDLQIQSITRPEILELLSTYDSGQETFPIEFPYINGSSQDRTVTLRPSLNAASLNLVSDTTIFIFRNSVYITIDGRPGGIAAEDHLALTTISDHASTVLYSDSTQFDSVKNCSIYGGDQRISGGVVLYDGYLASNNVIENCLITNTANHLPANMIKIFSEYIGYGSHQAIEECTIKNFSRAGIEIYRTEHSTLAGNLIYNEIPVSSGTLYGINNFGYYMRISRNIIYNLNSDLTSANEVYGINTLRAYSGTVDNNFISLAGNGYSTVTGIFFKGELFSSDYIFYYNTIYIYGNCINSAGSSCFYRIYTLADDIDYNNWYLKNNIFINKRVNTGTGDGIHLAISVNDPYYSAGFDYNDYYVDTSNNYLGMWGNTFAAGINEWKALSGRDEHSISREVNFISDTDLHLTGSSLGDTLLIAEPLNEINYDIDSEPRDPLYPYKGADENPEYGLPVELVSFTASATESGIRLEWKTGSEINNRGFEIERKESPGIKELQWTRIGFVNGSGTTSWEHIYTFTDRNVSPGKYMYRLKQINSDGSFRYSKEVEADAAGPAQFRLDQNHPNPFNPATTIYYQMPEKGFVTLKVYDILGNEVATLVKEKKDAGRYPVTFDGSRLASGVYIYQLRVNDYVSSKKMLLLK